jgi:very-short-patch-repair endonuclease
MKYCNSVYQQQLLAAEQLVFVGQLGLATRAQVLGAGVTPSQIRTALSQGRWVRVAPGVYGLAAWPSSDTRRLLAACLVSNGVASHLSAAWLWGLIEHAPPSPIVSVAYSRRLQRPQRPRQQPWDAQQRRPRQLDQHNSQRPRPGFGPIQVHRTRDLDLLTTSYRYGVPTTNPLRTLVDLAGHTDRQVLDSALDAALACRLVTTEGLLAEASRLERPGRRGPSDIKERLRQRAFIGAPSPSVLESQALRLLAANGIPVRKCEVVVDGARHRIDIQLADTLFVEVDGYAYHWSPEQKRSDDARRNQLRLLGLEVLVYSWHDVVRDGQRLLTEVRQALTGGSAPSRGSDGRPRA